MKFSHWSVSRKELDIIKRIVADYNIHSVVEFGMGVSTYAFQDLPIYLGYETHESTIREFQYLDDMNLVLREDLTKPIPKLDISGRFDLAFVDAPTAFKEKMLEDGCARIHTIKAAAKLGKFVLIHDSNRAGEQKSIKKLLPKWERVAHFNTYRGLTLFKQHTWIEDLADWWRSWTTRRS